MIRIKVKECKELEIILDLSDGGNLKIEGEQNHEKCPNCLCKHLIDKAYSSQNTDYTPLT